MIQPQKINNINLLYRQNIIFLVNYLFKCPEAFSVKPYTGHQSLNVPLFVCVLPQMIARGKNTSELFPAVVKNVACKNIEVSDTQRSSRRQEAAQSLQDVSFSDCY